MNRSAAHTALITGLLALLLGSGAAIAQNEGTDPALEPQAERPQAEVRERNQDWIVRCQPAPEDAFGAGEFCEMYQQVSEQQNDQTVLEAVVGFPPDSERPVALFNLPLGMLLPPGVAMSIDGGEAERFAVQICLQAGCRTSIELGDELLGQLRAGERATLTIADPQNREVEIPLSLLGFSASLETLRENRP
jgi:invasion protein IalB